MLFTDWSNVIGNFAEVILMVFGGMVFYQIKIAKDDLQTRCKRESAVASVELAGKFGKELIPLINRYYAKASSQGYILKKLSLKTFCIEEIQSLTPSEKQSYNESLDYFRTHPDFYKDCIEILNWLEVFSMHFTKGVANEDTLFTAAAQTYCKFVEDSFSILCYMRNKNTVNLFENTIELYNLWFAKMELNGLSLKKNGILEELQKINGGIIKKEVDSKIMLPIGVKKE